MENKIFITLGSQKFQFNRLLKAVDELCERGTIEAEDVFAQIGYSDYLPKNFSYKKFLDPPLMEKPMNQKPSLHQMEHYQKFYENGEYVRAVESTTEQNYNMIDGCANNLPKPRIINGRESVLDKLRIRQMAREKQKSSQEQSADMERNRK